MNVKPLRKRAEEAFMALLEIFQPSPLPEPPLPKPPHQVDMGEILNTMRSLQNLGNFAYNRNTAEELQKFASGVVALAENLAPSAQREAVADMISRLQTVAEALAKK